MYNTTQYNFDLFYWLSRRERKRSTKLTRMNDAFALTELQVSYLMNRTDIIMNSFPKGQVTLISNPIGCKTMSTMSGNAQDNSGSNSNKPSLEWLKNHYDLPRMPLYVWNSEEAYNPDNRKLLDGQSGIYMWHSVDAGKGYVGSAQNLNFRPFEHMWGNGPANQNFNAAVKTYGLKGFMLVILDFFDLSATCGDLPSLKSVEQDYLDLCMPKKQLFNISKSATGPRTGLPHTQEFKDKRSLLYTGAGHPRFGDITPDEVKKRMRDTWYANQRAQGVVLPIAVDAYNIVTKETVRYESLADFAKKLNVNFNSVKSTVRNNGVLYKTWRFTLIY